MNTIDWFTFKKTIDSSRTAIVGNAAPAGCSHLGESIDRATLIVRFNQARVQGFEQHVGSRTDVLICNLHPLSEVLARPRQLNPKLVLVLIDQRSARNSESKLDKWLGDTPVMFSHVPDILPSLSVVRNRPFTSGVYGLHLMLTYFDVSELIITGFNFYAGPISLQDHYWDENVPSAPVDHSLERDKEVFVQLLRAYSGKLTMSDEVSRLVHGSDDGQGEDFAKRISS